MGCVFGLVAVLYLNLSPHISNLIKRKRALAISLNLMNQRLSKNPMISCYVSSILICFCSWWFNTNLMLVRIGSIFKPEMREIEKKISFNPTNSIYQFQYLAVLSNWWNVPCIFANLPLYSCFYTNSKIEKCEKNWKIQFMQFTP